LLIVKVEFIKSLGELTEIIGVGGVVMGDVRSELNMIGVGFAISVFVVDDVGSELKNFGVGVKELAFKVVGLVHAHRAAVFKVMRSNKFGSSVFLKKESVFKSYGGTGDGLPVVKSGW
jgi:hypothetical protein